MIAREYALVFEHRNGRITEFPCDEHGVVTLAEDDFVRLYFEDYNRRRADFKRVRVQKREWIE